MAGVTLELGINFSNLSPGSKIFNFSVLLIIQILSFNNFNSNIQLTKIIPNS